MKNNHISTNSHRNAGPCNVLECHIWSISTFCIRCMHRDGHLVEKNMWTCACPLIMLIVVRWHLSPSCRVENILPKLYSKTVNYDQEYQIRILCIFCFQWTCLNYEAYSNVPASSILRIQSHKASIISSLDMDLSRMQTKNMYVFFGQPLLEDLIAILEINEGFLIKALVKH
jgi:hypothetical protein